MRALGRNHAQAELVQYASLDQSLEDGTTVGSYQLKR